MIKEIQQETNVNQDQSAGSIMAPLSFLHLCALVFASQGSLGAKVVNRNKILPLASIFSKQIQTVIISL